MSSLIVIANLVVEGLLQHANHRVDLALREVHVDGDADARLDRKLLLLQIASHRESNGLGLRLGNFLNA